MRNERKWFGLWHRHTWGPWAVGTFGYGTVRVRACSSCLAIRGPHFLRPVHKDETAERAIRMALGQKGVPFFVEDSYRTRRDQPWQQIRIEDIEALVQEEASKNLCALCEEHPKREGDFLCKECREM